MKVIDLLNKIANKEDVPKKIKYNDNIYELKHSVNHLYNYIDDNCDYLEDDWYLTNILNDEIEIIEDKKIPEKLDTLTYINRNTISVWNEHRDKINEIIDYIKGEDNE